MFCFGGGFCWILRRLSFGRAFRRSFRFSGRFSFLLWRLIRWLLLLLHPLSVHLFSCTNLCWRLFGCLVTSFWSTLSLFVIHVNINIIFWFWCKSKKNWSLFSLNRFLRLEWLCSCRLLCFRFGLLWCWSFFLFHHWFRLWPLRGFGIFWFTSCFGRLDWRSCNSGFSRWSLFWSSFFLHLLKLSLKFSCLTSTWPLRSRSFNSRFFWSRFWWFPLWLFERRRWILGRWCWFWGCLDLRFSRWYLPYRFLFLCTWFNWRFLFRRFHLLYLFVLHLLVLRFLQRVRRLTTKIKCRSKFFIKVIFVLNMNIVIFFIIAALILFVFLLILLQDFIDLLLNLHCHMSLRNFNRWLVWLFRPEVLLSFLLLRDLLLLNFLLCIIDLLFDFLFNINLLLRFRLEFNVWHNFLFLLHHLCFLFFF